jgi:hypothetical protein
MTVASPVRSGLLFQGRLESTSTKEARMLKAFLKAVRLAKRRPEEVPAGEIEAQLTNCAIAVIGSNLAAGERKRKSPKVKRFRIPLKLPEFPVA